MRNYDFMVNAKKAVWEWLANRCSAECKTIAIDWTDVFIVWQCKTLQNYKAILAAPTPDDYVFEVTYNGDKQELYVDAYDKVSNECIAM